MRVLNRIILLFCVFVLAPVVLIAQNTANLTINPSQVVGRVSPTLYGIMTEEINHSYDGGLYAELVSNRTLQTSFGPNPEDWILIQNGYSRAGISIDKTTGPSAALGQSLKLGVTSADAKSSAGFYNDGFWGMAIRPSTTYAGSFYAKADSESIGGVTIRLVNNKTGAVAASAVVPALANGWQRYGYTLKTGALVASTDNHLEFLLEHPGTAWFSLMSLFPPTYMNQANGFRTDLMEKLAALHPKFLRFPGGNYLEGERLSEHFDWKKTVGPLVDRPTHPAPWRYHSSDGLGLLEFLIWCEDLKMEPLMAVFSGFALNQEHVKAGKDLEPYVQDALDEIEYTTGSVETKWGAQRAKDGHPEPFKLHMIEVGNEEYHDQSGTYDARFAQFYKAIKKVHPEILVVAAAPVTLARPDIVDDNDHKTNTHFYRSAQQFFLDVHRYDSYDRNGPKILVGEWATREGSPTPNLGAALSDAAWMTGLERNSDLVVMASYAPLFVNVDPGGMQWPNDLIGYNAMSSYGSPSYWAQVMFGTHLGDQIVEQKLETENPRLFSAVTSDSKTKVVTVKLVNASSVAQMVKIDLGEGAKVKGTAAVTTLGGKTTLETNSITEPKRIVPVASRIANVAGKFEHTVPQYSIQVIEIGVE